MRLRISIVFLSTALSVGAAFAQSSRVITGTVTDAMCGAHHMTGKIPAQCTRECVKQGFDFALASGDKIYILTGTKSLFEKFAGQNVNVRGKIDGKTIAADSISAAKS